MISGDTTGRDMLCRRGCIKQRSQLSPTFTASGICQSPIKRLDGHIALATDSLRVVGNGGHSQLEPCDRENAYCSPRPIRPDHSVKERRCPAKSTENVWVSPWLVCRYYPLPTLDSVYSPPTCDRTYDSGRMTTFSQVPAGHEHGDMHGQRTPTGDDASPSV